MRSLVRVWALLLMLAATLLAAAASVRAQGNADAKAAAEALFDRAQRSMAEGKFEQACSQFEQSQAIERGIGTMLYLADCYERIGRTASAWALFREASSAANAAGQSERALAGMKRAGALEMKLSTLTITVVPEADLPGLTVRRGDVVLTRTALGLPIPVDPGEHRITASAPGYAEWQTTVTVAANAASAQATVPALRALPGSTPVAARPAPAPAQLPAKEPSAVPAPIEVAASSPPAAEASEPFPLRTLGLLIGGVGVLALGAGAYFGVSAIDSNDDAESRCPAPACADPAGVAASEDAQDSATLANVFVIGGAALAAAGVVLYLMAPSESAPALSLQARGDAVELSLGGGF